MNRILPLVFVWLFIACSGETETEDNVDIEKEVEELTDEMVGPVWTLRTDGEFFEIELPTKMEETDRLNPDASLQYRFVQPTDSASHEHFVIVMTEDFPDDKMEEVDLTAFTEAYLDSLMGESHYEVVNKPNKETVNDMETIIHEFTSSFVVEVGEDEQQIDLYYMFGVFKGERGVYQVLTWTLLDQKELFRSDMRHIMYSFKEIN